MKTRLKNSVVAGIAFGTSIGLIVSMVQNINFGFISFIFTSALFFLFMFIFTCKISKQSYMLAIHKYGTANILYADGANHIIPKESVGGFMILLKGKIVFLPHTHNLTFQQVEIPLPAIKSIKLSNNLGVIPNGTSIVTEIGIEKFAVNNRKQWITIIERTLKARGEGNQTQRP